MQWYDILFKRPEWTKVGVQRSSWVCLVLCSFVIIFSEIIDYSQNKLMGIMKMISVVSSESSLVIG